MNKSKIDKLQNNWYKSQHPKNNSNYRQKSSEATLSKTKDSRIQDLIELLRIIYEYMSKNDSLFKSGKDKSTKAFEKYVYNHIIVPFPNYSKDLFKTKENREDTEFNKWIMGLENPVSRAKSVPLDKPYPNILGESSDMSMSEFYRIKYQRFLILAKICHYIDKLQVEDYTKCKIKIDKKGKFIKGEGEVANLKYGQYHALSAYLGQHIIRCFPFKDFYGFQSSKYADKNCEKNQSVYEHFTPMSFFRDLIWVKNIDVTVYSNDSNIFESDKEIVIYDEKQWLKILWYRYRTITICKDEDDKLTHHEDEKGTIHKYKSRRPGGDKAYEEVGISINKKMKLKWCEIHDIENIPNNE